MANNFKIVVLEDNSSDLDILLYELKKAGLNFTHATAESAAGFETALLEFKPDLIISDYSMPQFDGVAAFHIKQKISPDVPFIIVSGTIGEENAVELIKIGIDDYAIKDKLFALPNKITRALKDAEDRLAKKKADEMLKKQYEKLLEIAFLQAHQVRGPIANILGLIDMFKENPNDPNLEVIKLLKQATQDFDILIHDIVTKTSEIKHLKNV